MQVALPILLHEFKSKRIDAVNGGENLLHRLGSLFDEGWNFYLQQNPLDTSEMGDINIVKPKLPGHETKNERQNHPPEHGDNRKNTC